jgi:hypothetical protein
VTLLFAPRFEIPEKGMGGPGFLFGGSSGFDLLKKSCN